MKATGVVRKLDNLGRLVIPIELRKTMGIAVHDPVEIYTDGDYVMLRKYAPGCAMCGEVTADIRYRGKLVCLRCAIALGKVAAHG